MKKLISTICALQLVAVSYSQEYFEVKSLGTVYSQELVQNAFHVSDFCGAFFASKRNKIVLDDGTVVELKSGQELVTEGVLVNNQECFIDDTVTFYKAIWSIDQNGHLMKGFDTEKYPSEKLYNHYNN